MFRCLREAMYPAVLLGNILIYYKGIYMSKNTVNFGKFKALWRMVDQLD